MDRNIEEEVKEYLNAISLMSKYTPIDIVVGVINKQNKYLVTKEDIESILNKKDDLLCILYQNHIVNILTIMDSKNNNIPDIEYSVDDYPEKDEILKHANPSNQQGNMYKVFKGFADEALKITNKKAKVSKIKKSKKSVKKNNSYVISVSLMPGCYRHIQINGNSTLEELHSEIINAFDFDDDHCHVFFMSNKYWNKYEAYYSEGMEGEELFTSEYSLNSFKLVSGDKFKYLYDFGDEWRFQCKVLKEVDSTLESPTIIRSVGNPPSQYGYDDDNDDDFDDDFDDDEDDEI